MGFSMELVKARRRILELEAKLAVIPQAGTIDIHLASSIILDKLDEMGDSEADLYLADTDCKIYNKEDVKTFLELDEVSEIPFVAKTMDCDDYAATMFGKFAGLVWTDKHALNWFIDETDTFWFIEPQTDKLSTTLEDWQGWDIRFFIGR